MKQKLISETIDELVDKYPHNDLGVRITSKFGVFSDNGLVEYFPEFYNNVKEEWSNISETYIRIIGCGYTDLNKAKECIEHHKLNGGVIKSSYVDKSIYF